MEAFLTGNYMEVAWIVWGLVSLFIGYYARGKDNEASRKEEDC